MPEKWTGELIGKMHNASIRKVDLAGEVGVSKQYITMILNGQRNPKGVQERLENAVDAIIARRAEPEKAG